VPALAAEDRVERRPRRRDGAARERSQHHGVIALLEHRFLGDLSIVRVAQP
jgi:hypothetical protein